MKRRGMLANLFAIRGGTSYESAIATTGAKGEAVIDREKYLDTGARLIPLSELEKPLPVRKGRWDAATGTVIYEDGAVEDSAAAPVAVKQPKVQKPPKKRTRLKTDTAQPDRLPEAGETNIPADKLHLIKRASGQRCFNALTDPRRALVIDLRQKHCSIHHIAKAVRMQTKFVMEILRDAGLTQRVCRSGARDGAANHNAKLTPDDIRAIRTSTMTIKETAAKFGVGRSTIVRIRARKYWAHVPDESEGGAAD